MSPRIDPRFSSYKTMLNRCYRQTWNGYIYYGGRGIKVCQRWRGKGGFKNFCIDLGLKPTPRHQIHRIDGNKNYEPSNCKWVTRRYNLKHRTKKRTGYFLNGKPQKDFASRLSSPKIVRDILWRFGLKKCGRCDFFKPASDFTSARNGFGKLTCYCRECVVPITRKNYLNQKRKNII